MTPENETNGPQEPPRRAIWRRSADAGTTWLGYLDADRERYVGEGLKTLGCGSSLVGISLLFTGHSLAALGLFAITLLVPKIRRSPRRDVEPLLTLPALRTTYACSVEVVEGDSLLGLDRGAVTFIDGWLHFEGFRTSFSLSRADVRKRDRNALKLDGVGVAFSPDDPTFDAELDLWYRIAPAVRGLALLPPTGVHPSGRVRAQADLLVNALLCVGTFAACVALLLAREVETTFVAVFVALRFLGSALEVRNAVRFLRKRRLSSHVGKVGDDLTK